MTYPLGRRYDIRSIGMWMYPVGRPTSETAPKWNFVLKAKQRVDTLEDSLGENGWILEVYCQDNTSIKCFVPSDIVSSSASLNKHLMRNISGAVSQIKSHDFLDFIAHDDPREICHCVSHVGKITINRTSIWIFQNMCLDGLLCDYQPSPAVGVHTKAARTPLAGRAWSIIQAVHHSPMSHVA